MDRIEREGEDAPNFGVPADTSDGHQKSEDLYGLLVFFALVLFVVVLAVTDGKKNRDGTTPIAQLTTTSVATVTPLASAVTGPAVEPTNTPSPTASRTPTPQVAVESQHVTRSPLFMPVVVNGSEPTVTPTSANTATPTPTPTPTIDFRAVRAELQAQGMDLGFAKIGFHTAVGGNRNGLGDWMRVLDTAGVPFFLKSVDDSGPLVEAQEIMRGSGVPHTLVYRSVGDDLDVPDYDLPPIQAAREHWQRHMDALPPELDPSLVWLETINEVDKNRSEWLAQFALETARLSLAGGFKWAAFGWSSGEPEVEQWQGPQMLRFLRLAAANPDRIAIALHEYSYTREDIAHEYPYKVGRFQFLYQVADQYGFARPTVLITEWGWEYEEVAPPGQAIEDIAWASEMYAMYPEVKGAAIWFLGPGYDGIADEAQKLIYPVTIYNLGHYFEIPLSPALAPINPEQFRP